ncbi:MAG: GGDEF domain-containing protein [Treponema sp.]|nr:GGDEF domain-containing protein [Treponema sp.]MCL2272255.1 GGDEF domain-containing protein [Treponema sp.]
MRKFLYIWRFYSFGREQYQECMTNVFSNNLLNLRHSNTLVAVFAAAFTFYPFVFQKSIFNTVVYLCVALVAGVFTYYTNFLMQQINVTKRHIFVLVALYYANVVFFGLFLGVFSNIDERATLFSCFLICSLLLFINPPQFNLALTLSAMAVFAMSTYIVKRGNPEVMVVDFVNTIVAGVLSIYFTWHITKFRMGMEISTSLLEAERNKFEDQSITDELTQLRNRRDFMHTFQRYLSNYRSSDDWICIALADIDFFKLYNDHYGHPKGDECLRGIGAALTSLSNLGVYAARVGGEEFALLWFEKEASNVDKVINQWTERIRDLKILHEKSKVADYVTMSIGVYVLRCGSSHDTKALYDLADKALYTAKGGGRNCAVICGDEIKEYKIASVP